MSDHSTCLLLTVPKTYEYTVFYWNSLKGRRFDKPMRVSPFLEFVPKVLDGFETLDAATDAAEAQLREEGDQYMILHRRTYQEMHLVSD